MKPRRWIQRAAGAAGLLCLLGLAAHAQPPAEDLAVEDATGSDGLGTDVKARSAYTLLAQGKLIGARESAEAILRSHPDSYEGHYVLGFVLHRAEGNLALALYHLKKARNLFEEKYAANPSAGQPWQWHASTLEELASVAGEMDLHAERLEVLNARDEAYDPKWPAERGWPLMRMRRFGEARKAVAEALKSDQPDQISTAKTTLCAIESEQLKRREAYEACVDAANYDRESNQGGPHSFTNAAGSALGLLRMDEAERLIIEGTKHFQEGATANPWLHMMWLYLGEGRTPEALDAVREMFAWQRAQPAYMDEQSRAETEFASALFLLVVGRASEAAKILDRTLERPDRTGFTSADSGQMEAAAAMLDATANRVAAEKKDEEASWSDTWGWLKAKSEARALRVKAWDAGRRAAAGIGDDRRLVATLRPYLPGSVAAPEWLEGDLCSLLGAGVMQAALRDARRDEDLRVLPEAAAYFDAFDAEIALLQGRWDDAQRVASSVLGALPQSEVLLQARAAAIGAQAAWKAGRTRDSVELFDRALQLDPGIVRRLGLALPCRITSSGGEVAARAAELLRGSPRFIEADAGFGLRMEGSGDSGTACLLGAQGEVLNCANVTPRAGETSLDAARRLVAELHERAFAPRVDLTQADLRSLDGSTTAGGRRTEQKFKSILDGLMGTETPVEQP